jgi:hypothetical protein
MILLEKKNNFTIRTLYGKEMEKRKELESLLRNSIDDVREEINRKKNETNSIYKNSHNKQLARSLN